MARKQRTNLPPVTEQVRLEHPDMLRDTPNGGKAWKCSHCGRYASSETQRGKRVCYVHGGVRKLARDPAARVRAKEEGRTPPRPPGRPLIHGFYAGGVKIRLDDLVEKFKADGLDPDDTDDDMLYLRAYLNELMTHMPSVDEVNDELEHVLANLGPLKSLVLSGGEGLTLQSLMDRLPQFKEQTQLLESASKRFVQLERFIAELETRHAELVRLAKVRAEMRVKIKAAKEVTVFVELVQNWNAILHEVMPPELYAALQKRFERDLSEISTRQLECHTVSVKAGKG